MKIIELLELSITTLKILQMNGIKMTDIRYVNLYKEYISMVNKGEKVSYTMVVLSNKYAISERKIYDLIKHFQTNCNISAI